MRPDSSALVNGVIAKLGSDAELLALLPNGIYEDLSPPAATRFAIVSQILATDTAVFSQGRVLEEALLLVEARVLRTSGGDAAAAAARIDALLEDGALDVPGYQVAALYREEFVRGTEVDEVDPTIIWKRRGGRYRVSAYREIKASVVAGENIHAPNRGADAWQVGIWFDGPLTVAYAGGPWPDISIEAISSDPLVAPNQGLGLNPSLWQLNVTDPSAPGRAMLGFQLATDWSRWIGVTFTISNASTRHNWSQILNAESGEPVLDSLGDVVVTITV